MKKIFFVFLLLLITNNAYGLEQTFYQKYGCEYTCGTKYYETERDSLGFTRKFLVIPCKYSFCYTKSGGYIDYKYNQFYKYDCSTKPYCDHFRFVIN